MRPEAEILEIIKRNRIFELSSYYFRYRKMTTEEMLAIFGYFNAVWQYSGKPRTEALHALLKSGKHSNGFINCKEVLMRPAMCALFAGEMVKIIEKKHLERQADVVVASAYSAIEIGYEVAKIIGAKYSQPIEYRIVEKDEKGNPTIIRSPIDSSKKVLIVNELMTTGDGSTWETKQAVLKCNGDNRPPEILKPAFVLVHRSKDWKLADGSPVEAIFHLDIEDFPADKCPYCKAGSEAIKPKIGNNWTRLHAGR